MIMLPFENVANPTVANPNWSLELDIGNTGNIGNNLTPMIPIISLTLDDTPLHLTPVLRAELRVLRATFFIYNSSFVIRWPWPPRHLSFVIPQILHFSFFIFHSSLRPSPFLAK
ncbi:MAG: hypothetical protein J6334_06010 [Kiritimatiellae bacterium]|nr:hypothetical protein [Kiritimatiellia bacterium]